MTRHGADVAAAHRHPVVSVRAGQAVAAFKDIQPIHRPAIIIGAPAGGKVTRVLHRGRMRVKEVRIERDNDLGSIKVVVRPVGRAEREDRARQLVVVIQRLVLVPFRIGHSLNQPPFHVQNAGRCGRFAQDVQPVAIGLAQSGKVRLGPTGKVIPARRLVVVHDVPAAVWIVQLQHTGLGPRVGRAAIHRMLGVAFDLDRSAVVARHQ